MGSSADTRKPSALRHPTKPGTVTVAGEPGVDIPKGTLGAIIRQAGLKK